VIESYWKLILWKAIEFMKHLTIGAFHDDAIDRELGNLNAKKTHIMGKAVSLHR